MTVKQEIPIIGFAAHSGTGKTTLLVKLLPLLAAQNIRTGIIKHAHHTFEIDHPGKDSYELRKAGAKQMLIGSEKRWALMVETDNNDKSTFRNLLSNMHQDSLDLILVEGFKPEAIPKIELVRPELDKPLFFPEDNSVIAIATDDKLPVSTTLPVLDLNSPEQIVEFIIDRFLNQKQNVSDTRAGT